MVDNNEGLPQALLGSCNDCARQIYIKMPIKDPSINPPTTSLFWKVRMLRGGEVRSRDLISPMLDKKRFRSPLPHLTRSDGLNCILSFSLHNCFLQLLLSFFSLMVLFAELSMSVIIQMRHRGCNLAESWVWLQDRSSFGFRTEENLTMF